MVKENDILGKWYHGEFDKRMDLKGRKFDVEDFTRNRNAVGPGLYFTRNKDQGISYAGSKGYVYTAEMDLKPARVLEDKTPINKDKLRKFVSLAPDKEAFSNYTEHYKNIKYAIDIATDMNIDSSDNMHDAIMGVYNDLYQRDSTEFAKSMTKIGYDALLHKLPGVNHLIVYNPDIIKILEEEPTLKESVSKYKNLKSFENFNG